MNLYKKDFGLVQGDLVRNSKKAAKKIAAGDEDYITTIKVEWEEMRITLRTICCSAITSRII